MFISSAWAQGAGGTQGGGIESMVLIVVMFGVLYFLMIRPQMKRAKEHKAMIEALAKGDEVESAGGILGRITKLNDNYVSLEVAQGVEVQLSRAAIGKVLPKGWATLAFIILSLFLFYVFIHFVGQAINALPTIANKAIPKLNDFASKMGFEIPFNDPGTLKSFILDEVPSQLHNLEIGRAHV